MALHARAEVLHVGDSDDRRLGLPIEVAAPRQQRVVDHVDHDAMLGLVLGAGQQLGGGTLVGVGVAGARCRAGERMGLHRVAVDRHEQLGHRADEAVDRVAIARSERRSQAHQHRVDVDRLVAADARSRGRSRPSIKRPSRTASRAAATAREVVVDRRERLGREALRAAVRARRRVEVGRRVVDGRDPTATVGGLDDGHLPARPTRTVIRA